MNDSIPYIVDIYKSIEEIERNTEPLLVRSIDISHLASWSFAIAIFSLIAGVIAAYYSYRGYKFQRISADHLESLVPGQMSYYEIAGCLINNILSIEAIYFGNKSYKSFPTKLILSIAKLPDELIQLDKYEKNQVCFDEAFKLKISWQNYNNFIDSLIDFSIKCDDKRAQNIAQFMINLSKTEISKIQSFEHVLLNQKYLKKVSASPDNIASYTLNRFFEVLHLLKVLNYQDLDTKRSNLKKETRDQYTYSPYFPNIFNFDNYLEGYHKNRLSDVSSEYESLMAYDSQTITKAIRNGEYDYLGGCIVLPKDYKFKDIDFVNFKSCYYNFIEPILVGHKRKEYSSFLDEQ